MKPVFSTTTLDSILALQIAVAWAGEGLCQPPRLAWWRTDLTDPLGGGDLLKRLLPRTHAWAALDAVREAAIRVDSGARAQMPDADRLHTLFFLGFDLNKALDERLGQHKRSRSSPRVALELPVDLEADFSADALALALRSQADGVSFAIVPGGRQLKGAAPDAPEIKVQNLAAALLPFSAQYPMPFYTVR